MNFNQFSNRSQNYGNVRASGRNELIAQSRAKRKQRQKRKKDENGATIIQKWFRMNMAHNQTIYDCRCKFDNKITAMLQNKNQNDEQFALNSNNLNHLLYLFRMSIFGFVRHPNKWSLNHKYNEINADTKWFTIALRRVYSIFLQLAKSSDKSQHFISQIIGDNDENTHQQMQQFQFLSIIFIKYLELKLQSNDIKEQQSIIMCLWSMFDCNKWKYFDKQVECQLFCYQLLQFVFTQTPFLSLISAIFTRYMKLTSKDENNSKTILALLHTIIIRYFQYHKIHKKQNVERMDVDHEDNEHKTDTKETEHQHVVSLICLHILSIPFYCDKLSKYSLDSVIKSLISKHIWNEIVTQLEKYCISLYESFALIRDKKTHHKDSDLWQKPIHFIPHLLSENAAEEKKQTENENALDVNVMNIPDYIDYDDSDSDDLDEEMNENQNVLQTFMNITEQQNDDNDNHNDSNLNLNTNNMEIYMNPNKNVQSLSKRKKRRNKRKRKKKGKIQTSVITELPAIVWIAHNLLHLLCDEKKFESNLNKADAKELISFLNISQIVFKLLDLMYSAAFPYDNPEYEYDGRYVKLFDKWCCNPLLSAISSLMIAHSLSLNDYSKISKYLLQIIAHFPSHKEHHIWSSLSLIPTENNNDSNKNMIVMLYKNVFCKYNIWKMKDWQLIMTQFLNGFHSLTYFLNKKNSKQRNKRMDEYNSCLFQVEEATKRMEIFELFLFGLNHELRIIDDHQFHKYHIPFSPKIWMQFIQTFKYIIFVKYWKYYHTFNKLKPYFKRHTNPHKNSNKVPLSTVYWLESYSDKLDEFVSNITSVFASLRDRNTRKSFTTDDKIWLMDKYIDLDQFEREILNLSNDRDRVERKVDHNDNIESNSNINHDPFNPFSNREFGYNEMYGGSIAIADDNIINVANQSSENLKRFEDNFSEANKSGAKDKYRRSFLILISIPFVIPFKLRVKLFYALIEFEKDELESSGNSIRINRGNAIQTRIRRDNILDDGYQGLNQYEKELKSLIQIEFYNKYGEIEAGIDGGGIFKEFLNELIRDAFDPQRGLFMETEYKNELYPNPNYATFKQLMNVDKDYYLFLGKMVAKALYDSVLIEPIFSQFFIRKLLSQHNYVDDLQSFDIDLYKQLMALKHDYANKNKIENMEISFSVTQDILGSKQTHDLIPNGSQILVNHENRHKYIHILADYKLNKSMCFQSISFLRGLSKVINVDYLRMFDATELSKLLSGDTDTQHNNNWIKAWKDLRQNTIYSGGFHNAHRCIKWFWQILNDDLTNEDNQKFLMFVTSCTRSPLLGFKSLNPKFSIMCTGGDTTNLPTSQTCMNLLKLPNYSTKQLLKHKLIQSIRSNAGFDLS